MELSSKDLESALQRNLLYDFSSDEDMDDDEEGYITSEVEIDEDYEEFSDENLTLDADNKEDNFCHRGENNS